MKGKRKSRLLEALERLEPHDHLCLVHESHEEQLAAIIPFIRIGLERGEKCIYIADSNTTDSVLTAMRQRDMKVDAEIESGALSVLTEQDSYLKQGGFVPDRMIEFLSAATTDALNNGFKTLRVAGEMTWIINHEPSVEVLIEYEAKLNHFFAEYACLAMCQYDRHGFTAEALIDIIRVHPLVFYSNTVCRNFYYVPPDELLEQEAQKGSAGLEREKLDSVLAERERKYRALFDESKDGILESTVNGRIIDINPAGIEMLGYSSKDEVMKLVSARELCKKPEDYDRYFRLLSRKGFVKNYEMYLLRKDGKPVVVGITSNAVFDREGKAVSSRGIMRDMTSQRLLENQLFESQKMEAAGQLSAGVAHDFNNFLTAIDGYIDLAALVLPPESPAVEDLREARASCDRAALLARQLLLFGHQEYVEMVPVNLNQMISDFLKVFGRLIGSNYVVQTDLDEDLDPINADMGHIDQVLMNLVINARDATPGGGVIKISSRNILIDQGLKKTMARKPGSYVCIEVRDWGTGMDDETIAQIFKPFFSMKAKGKGTGLGLSVVSGIMKQHSGWIDVVSAPGTGSTFQLYFPATDAL
ncbi:MAG: MEDS domain-containing protein, partial [Thermoleophilia bacterium]